MIQVTLLVVSCQLSSIVDVLLVVGIGVRKGGFQGSKPPLEEWCLVIYTVHCNK